MSKSKGLSMDPCGKPDITILHIPKQVPTLRLCFQRQGLIQDLNLGGIR